MVIYHVNFAHGVVQVVLVEKARVVTPRIRHLCGVCDHQLVDRLGWVGHVAPALEVGLLEEKGNRTAMVQMETWAL